MSEQLGKDLRGPGHNEEGRARELIDSQYIPEAKRRLLASVERNGAEITPETKILEIGSGSGELTKSLMDDGYDVMAIDIYPAEGPEIPLVVGRAEEMPFKNDGFDVVFSLSGFDSHFYPGQVQEKMLTETLRVLKPDGVFIHFGIHGEEEVRQNTPRGLQLVDSSDGFDVYRKVKTED